MSELTLPTSPVEGIANWLGGSYNLRKSYRSQNMDDDSVSITSDITYFFSPLSINQLAMTNSLITVEGGSSEKILEPTKIGKVKLKIAGIRKLEFESIEDKNGYY